MHGGLRSFLEKRMSEHAADNLVGRLDLTEVRAEHATMAAARLLDDGRIRTGERDIGEQRMHQRSESRAARPDALRPRHPRPEHRSISRQRSGTERERL
jgi:hypothetical protein